uniref:Transmembrane protein n=1 Tax=Elaeophora elaphi TaxID=1147741 RepID=A0A0R3RS03_9BILA
MGQKDGLLLDSDDSDIPDLDLPTANVRKERPRANQNGGTVSVRRQSCSVQIALIFLLSAIVIAIAFLGFFISYISSQLEQLRNDPRREVATRELEIIKYEVNRIKLDIDMLRLVSSSPDTPVWNASSLLYTRLEHIESQISDIANKVQEKLNDHLGNDTLNLLSVRFIFFLVLLVALVQDIFKERIDALADACIQGCGAISKLVTSNDETKYTFDPTGDKLKKKRSKIPQWSFTRDTPVVFTRGKHV